MSNDTKNSIAWWIVAVFYLKATFATGEDVRALSDRITKSETAILLLTEKQKDDIRQDDLIKDHEIRLRNLERGVR
jgi:hypothetical protein